jgi:hypothetical protein
MTNYYKIETPKKNLRISIRLEKFNIPTLGEIERYRAKCEKFEAGGKTEKAAYFNLLEILIKKMK